MTLSILMLQVTFWLLAGIGLYSLQRKQAARTRARSVFLVLIGVLLLTAMALVPLPGWPLHHALAWIPPAESIPSTQVHQSEVRVETEPLPPSGAFGLHFDLTSFLRRANLTTAHAAAPPQAAGQSYWDLAIPTLLLVCVALGMVRLLLGLWAVRVCKRRSRHVTDAALQAMSQQLQQEMGIARSVELRTLKGLGTPATIGWRKPVILLPESWPSWSEEERRSVLAHELAHVQAGDYARWLLAQLGAVLHGYQPLVHWLLARLHREQELAADLAAAQHAGGTNVYLRSLCRLALARTDGTLPFPARTFLPVRFSLIRRITMLRSWKNDGGLHFPRWRRWCGLAMLLLVGIGVAGLRSAGGAQEKPDAKVETLPPPRPDWQEREVPPFVMNYLRKETIGVIAVRPSAAFQLADMKPWQAQANALVHEMLKEIMGKDSVNLGLEQIEQAILEIHLSPKTAKQMGNAGTSLNLIRLTPGHRWQPLLQPFLPKLETMAHGQGSFYRFPVNTFSISPPTSEGEPGCLYLPDDRTLVFASEAEVRRWLTMGKPTMPDYRWKQDWQAADTTAPLFALAVDGPRFRKAMGLLPLDDPRLNLWVKVLEQAPSLVFYMTHGQYLNVNMIVSGEQVSGATLGQALLTQAKHLLPFFAPQAAKGEDGKELSVVVDLEKKAVRLQLMPKAKGANPMPQQVVPAGAVAIGQNIADSFQRLTFQQETSITLGQLVGSVLGGFPVAAASQPNDVFQAEVKLIEVPVARVEQFGRKHFGKQWPERVKSCAVLSAEQSKALLEAVQESEQTKVLCSPTVQVHRGLAASIVVGRPEEDAGWQCKLTMTDAPEGNGIVLDLHHRYNDDGKGMRPKGSKQEKPKHKRVLAWSYGARETIPPGHSMLLVATGPEEKTEPGETTFLVLATPSKEAAK